MIGGSKGDGAGTQVPVSPISFFFMKVSGNTPLPPHPPFELPLLAKGAVFLPKLNRERGESLAPPPHSSANVYHLLLKN